MILRRGSPNPGASGDACDREFRLPLLRNVIQVTSQDQGEDILIARQRGYERCAELDPYFHYFCC